MESLQHVEHRPVLVVEQTARYVDAEIGRDPDEILVERSMVDRAQAQAVAHDRLTCLLRVADDVRSIE